MRKLAYAGKLFGEFVRFARAHKVYWIVPLILLLGLTSLLIVLCVLPGAGGVLAQQEVWVDDDDLAKPMALYQEWSPSFKQ